MLKKSGKITRKQDVDYRYENDIKLESQVSLIIGSYFGDPKDPAVRRELTLWLTDLITRDRLPVQPPAVHAPSQTPQTITLEALIQKIAAYRSDDVLLLTQFFQIDNDGQWTLTKIKYHATTEINVRMR